LVFLNIYNHELLLATQSKIMSNSAIISTADPVSYHQSYPDEHA